jgi:hypothetical protein
MLLNAPGSRKRRTEEEGCEKERVRSSPNTVALTAPPRDGHCPPLTAVAHLVTYLGERLLYLPF